MGNERTAVKMARGSIALLLGCAMVFGTSLAQSKPVTLTVSAKGDADYKTVQEAVDHATEAGTVIRIQPGIYKEKIMVAIPNLTMVGLGASPKDVVLTFGDSAKNTGSTFKSGTVTVDADGFAAENLTIVNTWWDEHTGTADGSQAVALQLSSDKAVLDRVRLISGQDTLFAASRTCRSNTDLSQCAASRQYFNDCYIEGNVDYIFGDAKAVFERCELHSRPHGTIMITAQSKHFPAEDSGYYFLGCRITGANNGNRVVLGRPWREYAKVVFYDTDIEQKIAPEGWSEWGDRLKTATYLEYRSHGPGVNEGGRVIVYPPLTTEVERSLTTANLLKGSDAWDPAVQVKELRQLVP
jgi:pectinesterase